MKKELESPQSSFRVAGVVRYIVRHPIETLVLRWNWKAAFLSALLRAPIFFVAYFRKDGLKMAFGAAIAQSVFRIFFGGMNGSIIQSFAKVDPAWHAVVTVPLLLAAFSHLVEWVVQSTFDNQTGARGKASAITVSVVISVVSAVFNLFAMRRGALLVKDESQESIWRDLRRMPWIALEFLSFPLIWTWRRSRKKAAA
ncbi:MAG: hypothetical protein ABI878_03980 [Acidobacteriota bacterium]